jgi:hypothetical protein
MAEGLEGKTKEEKLEKAVREIKENTALHRETLLLNGYKDASNTPEFMSKQINGGYDVFKRNDKGLYARVKTNHALKTEENQSPRMP